MVKANEIKIPVTVESMGEELKQICDNYISGSLSNQQAYADFEFLRVKRQDLFVSALTVRWVGKKRLKLIKSILGELQLSL